MFYLLNILTCIEGNFGKTFSSFVILRHSPNFKPPPIFCLIHVIMSCTVSTIHQYILGAESLNIILTKVSLCVLLGCPSLSPQTLLTWINGVLEGRRIIVRDIVEDIYDGQVLGELLGEGIASNYYRGSPHSSQISQWLYSLVWLYTSFCFFFSLRNLFTSVIFLICVLINRKYERLFLHLDQFFLTKYGSTIILLYKSSLISISPC